MTKPNPTILAVFGATGDLARRKLFTSIEHLAHHRMLPEKFTLIGITRNKMSEDAFFDIVAESINNNRPISDRSNNFAIRREQVRVFQADASDPAAMAGLEGLMDEIGSANSEATDRLLYLSLPPKVVPGLLSSIKACGMEGGCTTHNGETRVVVEKPFGVDLQSAQDLKSLFDDVFNDDDVFHIDHYLGKETVQNLITLRLGNDIFESLWSNKSIEQIQITAAESIGIEGRAEFYDQTGALRDMLQSHILQVLDLILMKEPDLSNEKSISDNKKEVLDSLSLLNGSNPVDSVVFGQYGVGDDSLGYRNEPGIKPNSRTETFAALALTSSMPEWEGVPLYLRSGKAMARKVTEIHIAFKSPSTQFSQKVNPLCQNVLTIRLQPNEGMSLTLGIKKPGFTFDLEPVHMDFCYSEHFESVHPGAYERLIYDAMTGDKRLFTGTNRILQMWSLIDPILKIPASERQVHEYAPGSWGPDMAGELLAKRGHRWFSKEISMC